MFLQAHVTVFDCICIVQVHKRKTSCCCWFEQRRLQVQISFILLTFEISIRLSIIALIFGLLTTITVIISRQCGWSNEGTSHIPPKKREIVPFLAEMLEHH
jgi:hypothetical protein